MRRTLLGAFAFLGAAACSPGTPEGETCKGRMPGDLVITEYLNDPAGSDTGAEWIEVFNTLGTDLDLKGVKLYLKKTDGTGLKTHVIRAGTVASRGYFVLGDVREGALPSYVNYAYEGDLGALSNTDGVMGLSCLDTVFDEVSYKGPKSAAHARQLDGRLTIDATTNDDDTKWCDSPTALAGTMSFGTPGQANPNCTTAPPSGNCTDPGVGASRPVVPPLPGQVFFTEVHADPKAVGDDVGEFLEVHTTADVDLNDLVLTVGSTSRPISSDQCLRVPAGGYAVFAHETDAGINGGLTHVTATFTTALTNSGGTVALSLEDAGIDTATYPSSVNGIAWQLDPTLLDATSNDSPASYCRATARYGDPDAGDLGTPGLQNSACTAIANPNQCNDPMTGTMRAVVPPAPGELFFTEVMADPKLVGDTLGEWLELKSNAASDLNGLVLTVGASTRTLSSVDCLAVSAGGYALLAHNSDPLMNGGLPKPAALFSQALGNSGSVLSVGFPDGGLIDSATYPAAIAGVAWQLNPAMSSSSTNDDPMNYCRATLGYPMDGGDLGTPGGANTMCPTPPNLNDCLDPISGSTRPIVKPTLGQLVITEFMPDPTKVDDTAGEYIEIYANASFDLNGLTLANDSTGMSTVTSQACLPVTAGSYSVFAHSVDPTLNGGLNAVAGTFSFALANSAPSGPRNVTVRSDTNTLDIFSYSTVTSGASWQLRPGLFSPDDNEDAGSVCPTPTLRYTLSDGGVGDRGTPGAVNEACP